MTVHYASYGSNMDVRRFKPYVVGGPVPGTDIVERGSSDRTPIDLDRSKLVRVPGLLYTAGTPSAGTEMASPSSTWRTDEGTRSSCAPTRCPNSSSPTW